MTILGIVKGLLTLGSLIMRFLNDRQLIDAGRTSAISEALSAAKEEVNAAHKAHLRLRRDPEYRERVRESYRSSK